MSSTRVSDDDPIYDYVASDDDYYMIPETPVSDEAKDISTASSSKPRPHSVQSGLTSSPSKSSSNKTSSRATTAFNTTPPPPGAGAGAAAPMIGIRSSEYNELRAQLESSEAKV